MPENARPDRERLRVAIDATPLLGTRTGVGRFCEGALRALAPHAELEVDAFAVTWRRRHWLSPVVPRGVGVRQRAMPARPLHLAWSHLPGPAVEWFVGRTEVVHGTNFVVPPTRRAARVVTVHDLTAVRFPELCDRVSLGFPRMVRRAVSDGAWVHTPSRFVADEVVEEFGVDPGRVRVVYHGVPYGEVARSAVPADEPRLAPGMSRYVLAVGTVEPRKDYPGLVRAFGAVADAHPDVALVIAGADGWGAAAFHEAVDAAPWRHRVVQLGYVADDALVRWLAGAEVLAFPSVYEGFGFPPLEAMAAGVPVVASAAGAVPEIVGDAAVLVPPRDVDALAGALVSVLDDAGARAALVEKGRCRVARFTWEACGDGLAELYADAGTRPLGAGVDDGSRRHADVLVVAEQLRRRVPGGIGTYVRGLLRGLRALEGTDLELPRVSLYASRGGPGGGPDPLEEFGRRLIVSRLPGPVLTRLWDRGIVRAPDGFDLVHAVSLAVPPARRAVAVVAVADVAWRHRPEDYPSRGRRWHEAALIRAVRHASHFVVPSDSVARDIVQAGAPERAVTVIPLGSDILPDPDDARASALLARLGVRGEFLLSVGTLEPRKNLPRLFEAYAVARLALPEPWPLVVVGPPGWGPEAAPGTGVVFTGRVEDGTLAALYARARLLAYVPFEEGFGLPPVEAMRQGTPVVASPLPTTGGASFEVDPTRVDEIAQALVAVALDDGLRAQLSAAGTARAGSLTWESAARAHVALWRSLL